MFWLWLNLTLGVCGFVLLAYAAGMRAGRSAVLLRMDKPRSNDWPLLRAAHDAALKLRCELHRGTVEPKSEYDALIHEAAKHHYK